MLEGEFDSPLRGGECYRANAIRPYEEGRMLFAHTIYTRQLKFLYNSTIFTNRTALTLFLFLADAECSPIS